MSLYQKATLKILLGVSALLLLFSLTKTRQISEIIPATTGLKGLVVTGVPSILIIWGTIELVSRCSLKEAAEKWDALRLWKKIIYSLITILFAILLNFIIASHFIYS